MKKLFLISFVLFIISLIFFGIYIFVYKNNGYQALVDNVASVNSGEEAKKEPENGIFSSASVQKVSEDLIVGAITDSDDQNLWYVTDSNPALIKKQTLLSGGIEVKATLPYGVSQIRWSPDMSQALVQEVTSGGERWHLISLSDGKDISLKNGLRSPVWTNAGDRIVYVYTPSTGKQTLNLSRPDGSDWNQLTDIWMNKSIALETVPQSSWVALWNIPSAFDETKLQTVSLGGGDPKTVFSARFGSDYLFSPDGSKILVASSEQRGGNKMLVGIANSNGGEYHTLDVPVFINKIVWGKDNNTLYYALPGSFSEAVVVPDDYRKKTFFTQDTFWKIDSATGKKSRLVDLNDITDSYDATKMFLDHAEQSLFFIDRRSHILYRIKLY